LLGAPADSAALIATRVAAATADVRLPLDTGRAVAIVFPGFAGRAALQASVRPTYAPWMVDLLVRLRAEGFGPTASGVGRVDGRDRLVLVTNLAAGSLRAARLASIAEGAASVAPPIAELDGELLPDAEIARWQRPVPTDAPSSVRRQETNAPSDGRWLWLAALALLLIEIPLRRQRLHSRPASVEENARAA
jgi:hypothetical protein